MFRPQIEIAVLLLGGCVHFASSTTATTHEINYFETFYSDRPAPAGRNAIRNDEYKWPNGTVPYIFHSNYTADDRTRVQRAMELFADVTCTRFVQKTDDHVEHIRFVKADGCGSNIGYRRGQKEPMDVSYNAICLTLPGAMQHEMLHVLGLLHEQCRPDRDDYVTVVWENIEPRECLKILVFSILRAIRSVRARVYFPFIRILQ